MLLQFRHDRRRDQFFRVQMAGGDKSCSQIAGRLLKIECSQSAARNWASIFRIQRQTTAQQNGAAAKQQSKCGSLITENFAAQPEQEPKNVRPQQMRVVYRQGDFDTAHESLAEQVAE